MHVRKNDRVIIIAGREKGKVGKDGRPTRVGYKIEGETKTRISRRTGEEI
jgi:acid phosphatase class B